MSPFDIIALQQEQNCLLAPALFRKKEILNPTAEDCLRWKRGCGALGAGPIVNNKMHQAKKLFVPVGFAKVRIDSEGVSGCHVLIQARAAQHHRGESSKLRLFSEPLKNLQPILPRHFQVEYD